MEKNHDTGRIGPKRLFPEEQHPCNHKRAMMKLICFVVAVLICSAAGHVQLAGGPYVIQPFDVNAGGTTSTGGPYLISASTGQPGGVGTIKAEPPSAPPRYQFDDGFWSGTTPDCDGDGILDETEIADGTQCDANGNGAPDACECGDPSPCLCHAFTDGLCVVRASAYGDVDCTIAAGGVPVELGDLNCILDGYNQLCLCPNGDICGNPNTPCAPNGIIELCEVIAVLDAYAGLSNPCGCAGR